MYFLSKVEMQRHFVKIHMKITNSIWKVEFAIFVWIFLSLRLNFWYKVHLMLHYRCASFEILWIGFYRVLTFPPRRCFAPNIFDHATPSPPLNFCNLDRAYRKLQLTFVTLNLFSWGSVMNIYEKAWRANRLRTHSFLVQGVIIGHYMVREYYMSSSTRKLEKVIKPIRQGLRNKECCGDLNM